uniref:Sigma-70 family RNA polymerase sigma factor n=1 Tax=Roseihalotalea indica TaxID=2867963 RepID=A0AA49GNV4_9BACT|nr:sigma-70 family RNA polymerase sigma factor [Tunicatimonas sp. TK19036]
MLFKRRSNKALDDAQLLQKYQLTGELPVLGELYDRYMALVYGVSLKYFKNKEDSQDAVMQIFELLVERLRTEEVRQFKPWLYVVTRNYCLMQLRKVKVHHIPLNGHTEHLEETDDENLSEDQWQLLEEGMGSLPQEQQQCLQLFYWQQQSYQDIAARTGYELKQVKSHIQNGRRNLKIFVERNHE